MDGIYKSPGKKRYKMLQNDTILSEAALFRIWGSGIWDLKFRYWDLGLNPIIFAPEKLSYEFYNRYRCPPGIR